MLFYLLLFIQSISATRQYSDFSTYDIQIVQSTDNPYIMLSTITCGNDKGLIKRRIIPCNYKCSTSIETNIAISRYDVKFEINVYANYYYDFKYDCKLYQIAKTLDTDLDIDSMSLSDNSIFGLFYYPFAFNVVDINKIDNIYVDFSNDTFIGVRYYK